MKKPLAIDLFCGLGGWTEALLDLGYRVVGFDIEQHVYGEHRYPAQLVVQDVLTLDGAQFRDAALIVASPPCQEYSYMAMPWSRAKAIAAEYRSGVRDVKQLTALFDACFRIQREACDAAGRHIPMVVENVKGAQPWVGRARWNFGSFYLWGDVPALMPATFKATKVPGFRFDGSGGSFQTASVENTGVKAPGMNWSDQTKRGQDFTRLAGKHAMESGTKNSGGSRFNIGSPGQKETSKNPVHMLAGRKHRDTDGYDRTHPNALGWKAPRTSSKGSARKAASAMIAKIPTPLAKHIGATYWPVGSAA